MKKILTTSVMLLSFTVLFANIDPKAKDWNNKGIEKTFHKGDTVKIKAGSKGAKYVSLGIVENICNANYIKVDGYFIAIADVEVITKYYHVK